MKDILLKPTDLLVLKQEDYHTKNDPFSVKGQEKYDVGIIKHAGSSVKEELIGAVVYYVKGVATEIIIKNRGNFELVTENMWLLIRIEE